MTKVYIHGKLGEIFGTYYELNISKKMEVVDALDANKPGFKKAVLSAFKNEIHYNLVDPESPEQSFETVDEYLGQPAPEVLHILPDVSGSAVFAAFFAGSLPGILGTVGGFLGGGSMLANLAMSIILQGISALLFPAETPKSQKPESKVDQSSYLFSSLDNNATQGFPMPIIYGELRVGSNVVNVNIVNEDLA